MRLRCGQIVAIRFRDHVEDMSHTIPFMVYGELAKVTRRALVVDPWAYVDRKKKHDHNENRYVILRSAIEEVRIVAKWEDAS